MRNLYIFLAISTILMILLIAFVFVLFEREKHQSFFYAVEVGSEKMGHIEVDRYKTEDKIIYKSTAFSPKEPDNKIIHEKLIFDRKNFKLERWIKEYKNFGVTTGVLYLKVNKDGTLNFLAKTGSKFTVAPGIVHPEDASPFDINSIVTYMVFIDKYNFSKGGAQSFDAIYHLLGLLPPAMGKVIFISNRDEYININGKKTKTECMVVRVKALPKSYIWVSKNDKNIVKLENSSKTLLIKKVAFPQKIVIQEDTIKSKLYDSQDIIFPSEDIALAGTLAIPRIEKGLLPAILLVAGESPYDRENAGLYSGISHKFAQDGYIVLRFDRRGVGESQGDNMEASLNTEIQDIEKSLNFLSNHERVDKDKIFIVAHGESCSHVSRVDFSKFRIKGLVMLGIEKAEPFLDFDSPYVIDRINTLSEIDKRYQKILDSSKAETLNLIKNTKKEYAFVEKRRVFLKRMRQLIEDKPLENFKKLKIPLLIIQGKKDRFSSPTYVKNIEEALKEVDFQNLTIVYFRDLGHFFGELISEKGRVKYYNVDKEALETICDWINKKCLEEAAPKLQKEEYAIDAKENIDNLTNE